MDTDFVIKNENNVTMSQIIKQSGLDYGVNNLDFVLQPNVAAPSTILYRKECRGRGVEVLVNDQQKYINLCLQTPCTHEDVVMLMDIACMVCDLCDVKGLIFNGAMIDPRMEFFYQMTIDAIDQKSKNELHHFKDLILKGEEECADLSCVYNFVCLGLEELEAIDEDLDKFRDYLHKTQSGNYEYCAPEILQNPKNDMLFGAYYMWENQEFILPIRKDIFYRLIPKDDISYYYVCLKPDWNFIPYDVFMEQVVDMEYYDHHHVKVTLTEKQCEKLSEFAVEPCFDDKRIQVNYLGVALDHGDSLHSCLIRQNNFDLDEIVGYNHIAVFFRWMLEHDLVNPELIELCPELLDKSNDLRKIIREHPLFNGYLRSYHFSVEGREFAKAYYCVDGGYCEQMFLMAEEYFGKEKYNSKEFKNCAYLFVPYDENYYTHMAKCMDQDYRKFKQ